MDNQLFVSAIVGMAAGITAMALFIKKTYADNRKEQSEWRNLLIKQSERSEKVTNQFTQTIVDVTTRYESAVMTNTSVLMKLDATDGLDSVQVQRIGDQVLDISQTMERISNTQEQMVESLNLMRSEILAELQQLKQSA